MLGAIRSSETPVPTIATRRHILNTTFFMQKLFGNAQLILDKEGHNAAVSDIFEVIMFLGSKAAAGA
jgi:hypothetical protein